MLVAESTDVEVLLHRVRGREQADRVDALGTDRLRGRLGDVDEGRSIVSSMAPDTLCIVFVQSTISSAPAFARD
jgi:hypothetical protein